MEYLQQAQERFRQQSGSVGSGLHRPSEHLSTQAPPLVYSSTRRLELSEQAMRAHRLITGYDEGAFVDAYKRLRAQVMQQFRQKGWNVLGVSSPTAHEGKTLTAVNLSLALAMDLAHTVLLVDADMGRPAVHRMFGMEHARGLTEYLFDQAPLAQLLVHPGIGRLVFLPGGRSIKNSAEALASPRMAALAQEIKHRYPSRFIVFDLPPLLSRADVLGFGPHIDAVLLVVEEGRTSSAEVEQAVAAIAGSVPILGGVLNKSGRKQLTRRQAMRLLRPHSS
ncbi:MAG: CpsD/CapB family tyrosine-protein kinase [Nitrospira sp.]|nr:CpsD/CapB family tyrosine-protein kinase [Nitrospira sp.]